MADTIEVKLENGKLVISIPAETKEPQPSASGKTLLVASTHGSYKTKLQVNGQVLVLNLSAYIKAAQ